MMRQNRKKVLILVSTNIFGGAERVMADYLRDNEDFEFFMLTNRKPSVRKEYERVLPANHVVTSRFVLCRWDLKKHPLMLVMWVLSYLRSVVLVLQLIRRYQIDVIYGNNSTDIPILAAVRRWKPELKNVSHIHDMLETDSMMGKYFMGHAQSLDHIIVPSKANKEYLAGLMKGSVPITVAYNSVPLLSASLDSAALQKSGQGEHAEYQIAMVGTIAERKDPMAFLRILSELKLPFHAVMAGPVMEEPLYRKMKEFIADNKLPVSFTGSLDRESLVTLYLSTDLLLLTSKRDSLPNVILEAMAAGTLVLTRAVGGVPEMIEDGVTGFLYTEEDDAKMCAKRAESILQMSTEDKQRIRKNARERVQTMFSEQEKRRRVFQVISEGGHSYD